MNGVLILVNFLLLAFSLRSIPDSQASVLFVMLAFIATVLISFFGVRSITDAFGDLLRFELKRDKDFTKLNYARKGQIRGLSSPASFYFQSPSIPSRNGFHSLPSIKSVKPVVPLSCW